jgi:hypothetical protein
MDEQLRTVFFHPDRGSWDQDPVAASLRIDNRYVIRADGDAQLYRADGSGGWTAILDEQGMSGLERGLVFQVWKSQIRGKTAQVFGCLRALDQGLYEQLLHGLQPLDTEGRAVVGPAEIFALLDSGKESQARVFGERVQALGGSFVKASVGGPAIAAAISELREELAAVEAQRTQDFEHLRDARQGVASAALAHERAGTGFAETLGRLSRAIELAERLLQAQKVMERSPEERANADDLGRRVAHARERALVARQERDAEAVELALLSKGSKRPLPPPPGAVSAFRELAARAEQSGLAVSEAAGKISIKVGSSTLNLSLADGTISVG